MSKCILWNLYVFDIKKGFLENRIKIGIAVFIFVFLANVTIKDMLVQQYENGFLGYWSVILGGMPEYVKTDMSMFELPVSWLLFYAYLFYLIGFYPVSDLYGSGTKTLLLSENRITWMMSKYLWIATMIILYFLAFAICLFLNIWLLENTWDFGMQDIENMYGIVHTSIKFSNIFVIWMGIPILMSVGISYLQFTISIYTNAIAGYSLSVIMLVVSAYWMKPFLPANYLMIVRNRLFCDNGMESADGIVLGMGILLVSVLAGCLTFRKKDIYKTA